jgi:hexulose-6-phosphate isomerase
MQSFPGWEWREEFPRARALGFDAIEWLFDELDHQRNPLWSLEGIEEIRRLKGRTGIDVPSVCADLFLHRPVFRGDADERRRRAELLNGLVERASLLGARVVLVPVLEGAAVHDRAEREQLLGALGELLDLAIERGIRLGLEMDVPAPEQVALLAEAGHAALGCYYDTGNAAALGRDISGEIRTLAPFLCGIHIKDRPRGGGNVPLGEGDAGFDSFFPTLRSLGYDGPLILETNPGDDYHGNAKRNLEFVRSFSARSVA